jgi:hypothetical protein
MDTSTWVDGINIHVACWNFLDGSGEISIALLERDRV